MTHKKPTDLIELAQDWERKLAKCEAEKADLIAAFRQILNARPDSDGGLLIPRQWIRDAWVIIHRVEGTH